MFIFFYFIFVFGLQLASADFLEKTACIHVSKNVMIVMMNLVSVIMGAFRDGQDFSAKIVTLLLTMPTYIHNILSSPRPEPKVQG